MFLCLWAFGQKKDNEIPPSGKEPLKVTKYSRITYRFLFFFKFWSETIRANESSKGGCQLSVQDDFTRLTLDVLGKCVFSYKFNSITTGNTPISQAFNDATTGPDKSFVNAVLRKFLRMLPFYQGPQKIREAFKKTNMVIKKVTKVWLFNC